MTIYTLSANQKYDPHGRSEPITGTLKDIQTHLLEQAGKTNQELGIWTVWELDENDYEDDKEPRTPIELTPGSLKECASDLWDIHPNHITITEQPKSTDLHTIATFIAGKLRLNPTFTLATAENYLAGLEETDNRTINRNALSDNDIAYLTTTITTAQKDGTLGKDAIHQLEQTAHQLEQTQTQLDNLLQQRDNLIVKALGEGASVNDVAEAADRSAAWIRKFRKYVGY